MTTTKLFLIAAGVAAATFALFWLGIQLGAKPPVFGWNLLVLLLPAEVVADIFGTRASFVIAGFLEFFLLYMLALLLWRWARARKRV